MKKTATLLLICLSIIGRAQFITPLAIGDSTNFEVNASLVHIDTTAGNIWQIGIPQKTFFGNALSVPYAIMTDTINSYPINNLSSFTIEYQDTNMFGWTFPGIEIGFWHKYETDTLSDGGYVEISADSGASWTNVVQTIGIAPITYFDNFYSDTDTIKGNIPCFNGTHTNWMFSQFLIQMFIPVMPTEPNVFNRDYYNTSKFMFRFNFKSDSVQTNKAGWIIDNVSVGIQTISGGINENSLSSFNVEVFPNPINEQGILQAVSSKNEHDYSISIYNSIGQEIKTSALDRNNQYIIKANELTSGIYFYSIRNKAGENKNGKLIIK